MRMISTPRGMRDYSFEEAMFINAIISKIESVFKRFGFAPIITPSIENDNVLNAKNYGEEAGKEIFGIEGEDASLRYDFTMPMARYVAMNKDLQMPFKRYQIGTIWRKEEPQLMRTREFIQADVDIVGSTKISSDAEVLGATAIACDEAGFENYVIHLNSRILLNEILDMFNIDKEKHAAALRQIDKLYKIGSQQVVENLKQAGIEEKTANQIVAFISPENEEKSIEELTAYSQKAKEEMNKVQKLIEMVKSYGIDGGIKLDISLVRGFDYYTGFIWEFVVEKEGSRLPSIGGGGRYDNLIGLLSGSRLIPATGSSIGITRLFELTYEETKVKTYSQVFVAYISEEDFDYAFGVAKSMRNAGINTDLNLLDRSISKQLEYASSMGIPYTIIIGKQERAQGKLRLRDMSTGEEELLDINAVIQKLKEGA